MKTLPFEEKSLLAELETSALRKKLAAGDSLMNPGDSVTHVPIVLSGTLRILVQNMKGNEHFLYHIFPGETCAMSLTCCQTQRKSEIRAVAEDQTEVLLIPITKVEEWMKFPEWKKFVGNAQAQRFSELLETIELMAFSRLDEQLWDYLVKRAQALGSKTLHITHQEIANELNSPREVITRLLHQLREKGKLQLARNTIELNLGG